MDRTPLGAYLASYGASFHPSLYVRLSPTHGPSIYTSTALPAHTPVVSCAFASAITPTLARASLPACLAASDDHALTVLYLVLHRLFPRPTSENDAVSQIPSEMRLAHHVYAESLPTEEDMRTPCWFSEREMGLLRGTNLEGATRERVALWREEWDALRKTLRDGGMQDVAERLEWKLFLWGCTILSSRAFPSTLISPLLPAVPVLFPGVDTLNHQHAQPVLWSSDVHFLPPPSSTSTPGLLTITPTHSTPAHTQVFNNYGAKSTEEFLLGYGFVPSPNPSDVVVLKLVPPPPERELLSRWGMGETRFLMGLEGVPEELVRLVRVLCADEGEREVWEKMEGEGEKGGWVAWENEWEMLGVLEEMLGRKLDGLERGREEDEEGEGEVREDVRGMCETYREAQCGILRNALEKMEERRERCRRMAAEAGIELGDEEDDDEEEEEKGEEEDEEP